METMLKSVTEYDAASLQVNKVSPTKNLSRLFSERNYSYLNEFHLFLTYFNEIPNYIKLDHVDCRKANQWFVDAYRYDIEDMHYNKKYFNTNNRDPEYDDIFYILNENIIVYFNTESFYTKILFRTEKSELIDEMVKGFKVFRGNQSPEIPKISLLISTFNGLETRLMNIAKPALNINDNYNDDFMEVHQSILKRLSTKNDKGLVLLHGKPGTGKTSYIRYLVSGLEKNVIFLPPTMAGTITDPNLITVLIDNPNSVFVIEDAENLLTDRDRNGQSPVSSLLNITDGLLSDCLNVQIICSFNTDLSQVDSALLRKGRLIAKYEFRELEPDKAQKLSDKLGFNTTVNSPMTLTAIYNQQEKGASITKRPVVGFKSKS